MALDLRVAAPAPRAGARAQRARFTYNGDYEALDAVEGLRQRALPPRRPARRAEDGRRRATSSWSSRWRWWEPRCLRAAATGRGSWSCSRLGAMALIPLAFFGDVRFHVPASPLFAIAAAVAIVRLAAARPPRRAAPA